MLASRGARQLGEQAERIKDKDELRQVRWQAAKVIAKSVVVAIILTILVWSIPSPW